MRKIFFIGSILIFSVILKASDTTKIIILHTNDTHSKIDQMAKLAYKVDWYRQNNENVFLFSAGDIFTGNPIVDKYKDPGYPMIDLMNDIEYDISCIGNHEFDYGQKTLNKRIQQANFPFICANVDATDAFLNQPKPFHKFFVDDISIGVVGFIQIDDNGYPSSNPLHLGNLVFIDAVKNAKQYTKYSDSADILIALSHLGVKNDIRLAKKIKIFDAIIGGHSHTFLKDGIKAKKSLIVQASSYNNNLGVLTILYSNGDVVSISDTLIDIRNIKNIDPQIKRKIDGFNNNPYFYTVIGEAVNDITGDGELGALMTDAARDTLGVDIVLQNIGGIRLNKISKGDITIKNILELSPFGNTFVIMDLNVEQIKELFKYTYKFHNNNELQVSGVIVKLQLKPNGKIKNVIIEDNNGNLINDGSFSVAVNNYMALSYSLSFLKKGKDTGVVDADCTMQYIKKKKQINYSGVQRVIILE